MGNLWKSTIKLWTSAVNPGSGVAGELFYSTSQNRPMVYHQAQAAYRGLAYQDELSSGAQAIYYTGQWFNNGSNATQPTATALGASRVFYVPFFARKSFTIQAAGIYITTTGGVNTTIGIYSSDASGSPSTLLASSAAFSTTSAGGFRSVALSYTFAVGWYYFAFYTSSSAGFSVSGFAPGGVPQLPIGLSTGNVGPAITSYFNTTGSSLSSSVGAATPLNGNTPAVWFQIA